MSETAPARVSWTFARRQRRPSSLPPRPWRCSVGLWSSPAEAEAASRDWLRVQPHPSSVEVRIVEVRTRS